MKKKIIKWGVILLITCLIVGGGIVFYLFNMPHRDVQSANVDFKITATQLVEEYLNNAQASNDKYLEAEGESKILEVTGTVASIDKDMKQQIVVLLQSSEAMAGVSCTFTESTNLHAKNLKTGDIVSIKGVIRSGAGYDEDLEMYEDVIMEKCDIIIY